MHDNCCATVFSYNDHNKLRAFFEKNYPQGSYEIKDEHPRSVLFWAGYLGGDLLKEFEKLSANLWGFLHISACDSSFSQTDRHWMFFEGKYVGGWCDDMNMTDEDVDERLGEIQSGLSQNELDLPPGEQQSAAEL